MRKLVNIFLFAVFFTACSPKIIYAPIEGSTNVRDSVVISYRDSINWIPKEKIVNVTLPNQESNLETSLAISVAYTDSIGLLHHNLENKESVKTQYVYRDKIVYKDSIRIVEKPIPYEVEKIKEVVPKWSWWLLVIVAAEVVVFAVKIYLKIKSGGIQF